MGSRLELQTLLKGILGTDNVYFQPPPTVKMDYPCIVYRRDLTKVQFAEDKPYRRVMRYQVTVIDPNPDSAIPERLAELPMCIFERFYTADQLNHDVYKLFF